MEVYHSKTYMDDLAISLEHVLKKEKLRHCSILIAGASGMIGSYITDVLEFNNLDITIYAMSRNMSNLKRRFKGHHGNVILIQQDIREKIECNFEVDYVIHAAGYGHPSSFYEDPVGTIMCNIQGTKNLLDYAKKHGCKRFVYVSSGEVYGQGDPSLESFKEEYAGYVDNTSVRACYPNGKRAAETLCVSYAKQYGLDIIIVRPCHTYGPTITEYDNKAHTQFLKNVIKQQNIIMKSVGNQERSYCYIADTASAILSAMLCGKNGEAYNICNPNVRTTIAGFAKEMALQAGCEVEFVNPDAMDLAQRTPIAKQILDGEKIKKLGWKGAFSLETGIEHCLKSAIGK